MKYTKTTMLIRAAAVRDASGVNARPGYVCVARGRIAAAGSHEQVSQVCGIEHPMVDLPEALILPSMVNAHAHLELSNIGPKPHNGVFLDWLKMVIQEGPKTSDGVSHAVYNGIRRSHSAGVRYVGDITRSELTRQIRMHNADSKEALTSPLPGISYIECFGIGAEQTNAIQRLQQSVSSMVASSEINQASAYAVRWGLQPHAPYSAGLALYGEAVRLARQHGLSLSTHLAETQEEIEFVRNCKGPFVELLKHLGKWDQSITPADQHPIEWLAGTLASEPWLVAHCNYIEDDHIELLSSTNTSVAYCPIASDYFGHHRPDIGVRHKYREMLHAGLNVCLGTDSIVCQPADSHQPLSILQQMRHLYRRDRTNPEVLLRMATVHGALALGIPSTAVTLTKDAPADLNMIQIDPDDATDPLTQALLGNEPIHPINPPGQTV